MSGIASDASTIPGSVATFASCSSERSLAIASSSSRSAKTRAGTRMSGRESAGISQSVSSTRRMSDIEHRRSAIPAAGRLEREPVVGHGLDEVRRVAALELDLRAQARLAQVDRAHAGGHERLRLGEEDELLDERRQQ